MPVSSSNTRWATSQVGAAACHATRAAATSGRPCSNGRTVFLTVRPRARTARQTVGTLAGVARASFRSASVRSGCAAISAAKVWSCGSSMPRRPCRWTRGAPSPVSRRRCFSSRTHDPLTRYCAATSASFIPASLSRSARSRRSIEEARIGPPASVRAEVPRPPQVVQGLFEKRFRRRPAGWRAPSVEWTGACGCPLPRRSARPAAGGVEVVNVGDIRIEQLVARGFGGACHPTALAPQGRGPGERAQPGRCVARRAARHGPGPGRFPYRQRHDGHRLDGRGRRRLASGRMVVAPRDHAWCHPGRIELDRDHAGRSPDGALAHAVESCEPRVGPRLLSQQLPCVGRPSLCVE